jgi:CHAD domain-containing protein
MKSLLIYSKKRFKSLSKHLLAFSNDAQPECLHAIRLEIKKIKTLLHVTNFSVKGFKKQKHLAPFRTIFKKAGEIRQDDVFEKLALDYTMNEVSQNLERNNRRHIKLISDFQREIPAFQMTIKNEKGKLAHFFKKVKPSGFRKYLNLKRDELKELLYPKVHQRELHKTRKILKEIIYLSSVTEQLNKELLLFYGQLQTLIGQWHDKHTLISLLKRQSNLIELDRLNENSSKDVGYIKRLVSKFYSKSQ